KISVIKVYFLKIKKISAHNLSGGADTQNFSHTRLRTAFIFLYVYRLYNDVIGERRFKYISYIF
ncbi:MAG: hypothetical protein E6Y30_09045, partial [Finegoldia magna]|nr:hypothetical protein [Finegoldia magna]